MGRIKELLPFKIAITRDEWRTFSKNGCDYYFVDNGFFKLYTNLNSVLMTSMHIMAFIGFYELIVHKLWTLLFISFIYSNLASIGLTGGSHRLWAHRAFEAQWPLRLFLMLTQASGGIWSIRTWYINHVAHHKFSDTDGDPHNIKRGLFFSHGFFMYKKQHPLSKLKEEQIDLTTLMADPIVKFQFDNFELLFITLGMLLPTLTGVYFGGSLVHSFLICYAVKHFVVSHLASLINSAAHLFGDKPFNRRIMPGDNRLLSMFTVGEGHHNFHHQFPQDYATGEYGTFSLLTYFIEMMAKVGQAYNLKRSSHQLMQLTRSNNLIKSQLAAN